MWSTLLSLIMGQQKSADDQHANELQRNASMQSDVFNKRAFRQQQSDAVGQNKGIDVQSLVDGVFTGKQNQSTWRGSSGVNWAQFGGNN